jgi:hypothetical protein
MTERTANDELETTALQLFGRGYTELTDNQADAVYNEIERNEPQPNSYQPSFRYYTIAYTYPDGVVVHQGAYADRTLAEMNAHLNSALSATVEEVWY